MHNFNLVSAILVNSQFDAVSGIANLIQNNALFPINSDECFSRE